MGKFRSINGYVGEHVGAKGPPLGVVPGERIVLLAHEVVDEVELRRPQEILVIGSNLISALRCVSPRRRV